MELERVGMGDRGKRDEYRRGLDDDTYHTPVPLFHEPFTQFQLGDLLMVRMRCVGSGSLWGHGSLIMSWPCCGDREGGS